MEIEQLELLQQLVDGQDRRSQAQTTQLPQAGVVRGDSHVFDRPCDAPNRFVAHLGEAAHSSQLESGAQGMSPYMRAVPGCHE